MLKVEFSNWLHQLLSFDPKNLMAFNSGTYLVLFIFFILIYSVVQHQQRLSKICVVAFSLLFYYKVTGWSFVFIFIPLIVDFFIAQTMARKKSDSTERRVLLGISLGISIGMLVFFKYTGLFSGLVQRLSGSGGELLSAIVPVGISFYVFRTISYMIDVYRDDIKPETDLLNFTFYFTFFPLLISGPITRASGFLPQIGSRSTVDSAKISMALFFIIQGIIKKALIADYLAQYNNLVFAAPGGYSGFENFMAIYGYTLQIYFDFSGYTDIAMGIAMIIGFDIGINFNKPYHALNITDFWRRWHISLSTWLRDYMFTPLSLKLRGMRLWGLIISIIITFTLCGLWHDGTVNFIVWGLLNGLIMGFEFATAKFRSRISKKVNPKVYTVLSWLITFHVIALLWVVFKSSSLGNAFLMIKQVFFNMDLTYVNLFLQVRTLFVIFLFAGFAIYCIPKNWFSQIYSTFIRLPYWAKLIVFLLVAQMIVQFQAETIPPFIYAVF
jgi:alginate O-acetyltransferase complex protein AlgI